MYLMGVQIHHGRAILGEKGPPVVKYSDSAMSCAKMAELIKMLFGLWTQVGPRKH